MKIFHILLAENWKWKNWNNERNSLPSTEVIVNWIWIWIERKTDKISMFYIFRLFSHYFHIFSFEVESVCWKISEKYFKISKDFLIFSHRKISSYGTCLRKMLSLWGRDMQATKTTMLYEIVFLVPFLCYLRRHFTPLDHTSHFAWMMQSSILSLIM